MAGRMPVLRQDDVGKTPRQRVNRGDDRVAIGHGERTAGQEVVLEVGDEEDVTIGKAMGHSTFFGRAFISGPRMSIGSGNTIVEFLSAAITVSVSR